MVERVAAFTPANSEELADLVSHSLREFIGEDPCEYDTGRFSVEVAGLEIAVLATAELFPVVRFDHRVMQVPAALRTEVLEFANALHGRQSAIGARWWVGNESLWQQGSLHAGTFDRDIFVDNLAGFIDIARARTPEIRARLGDG